MLVCLRSPISRLFHQPPASEKHNGNADSVAGRRLNFLCVAPRLWLSRTAAASDRSPAALALSTALEPPFTNPQLGEDSNGNEGGGTESKSASAAAKSVAQEGQGAAAPAAKPVNYVSIVAAPSTRPPPPLRAVCGLKAPYTCLFCATRYCSKKCLSHHAETRCVSCRTHCFGAGCPFFPPPPLLAEPRCVVPSPNPSRSCT